MATTNSPSFRFKQFAIADSRCGMKLGTDGVLAGALARLGEGARLIADIGAGCGIIALMLAQRFEGATIDAVELDGGAFEDLKANIEASPWKGRVTPIMGDFAQLLGPYDLIVSNPPYFLTGETAPDASRAAARHAGSLSAASLVDFAAERLTPGGMLSMIIPSESAAQIEEKAVFCRMALQRRVDIATSARRGVSRTFLEFSNDLSVVPRVEKLYLNSDEYRSLTREFYLYD